MALVLTLLMACGGTTGNFKQYVYSEKKSIIENDLIKFINSNPKYKAPKYWGGYDLSQDSSEIYILFKDNNPRLFVLKFAGSTSEWAGDKCRLGFIAVYDGIRYRYAKDVSYLEELELENKLESEILSKLSFQYE